MTQKPIIKKIYRELSLINKNYKNKTIDNCLIRIQIAINIFSSMEKLMYEKNINYNKFAKIIKNLKKISNLSKCNSKIKIYKKKMSLKSLKESNQEVFYNVWKNFDKNNFKNDGVNLLKKRLIMNQIDYKDLIKDKVCVDAGCGSGRYSYALVKLGAKKVLAFDKNSDNIKLAKSRFNNSKLKFFVSNTLDLKIKKNSIDFIFSNGVIHHDKNIDKQLKKLNHILKKNGKMWVYVNGRMGLFEKIVETCKDILGDVRPEIIINYLNTFIKNNNKIYFYLDYLLPTYFWQKKKYFEKKLISSIFKIIKFLTKGIKTDQAQILYNNPSWKDKVNFFEGQLKYIVSKI
jgi:ubiquinone/menaquinone biosynthesis C-methylase UbiE